MLIPASQEHRDLVNVQADPEEDWAAPTLHWGSEAREQAPPSSGPQFPLL